MANETRAKTASTAKKVSAANKTAAKRKVSAKKKKTAAKRAAAKKKTSAAKKTAAKKTSAAKKTAAAKTTAAATKKPASRSRRKSWGDKLHKAIEPEVKDDPRGGTLLIPTPLLVDAIVRTVPRGKLITPDQIRERLAERYGADRTCPLCTGIFLNIVAGAAEEGSGDPESMTPYWRVVRENGALIEKFPAGIERQAALLSAEGHGVIFGKWKVPRVDEVAARRVG